jgi:hypothetical protein
LHDEDLAAAILDRILERGRVIHLDGPSWRTRHLNLEEPLPPTAERARISGIGVPEFSEPTRPSRFPTYKCINEGLLKANRADGVILFYKCAVIGGKLNDARRLSSATQPVVR